MSNIPPSTDIVDSIASRLEGNTTTHAISAASNQSYCAKTSTKPVQRQEAAMAPLTKAQAKALLTGGKYSNFTLTCTGVKFPRVRVEAYHFAAMYDMPFCKSTFGYESLKAIKLALSQHDVDLVGEQLDIVLGYIDPFDNNLRVWAATEVYMGQDILRQSESGREIVTLASAMMQNDWQELER
jgi:hypothetical protein